MIFCRECSEDFTGFTLLETIIVLAIMSIACLCYTGFHSIEKHHVRNMTTHLFEVLQWARTEAIKRNQMIGICGTKDFQTCDQDWSDGYIVFVNDAKSQPQILRFEKNNASVQVKSNQAIIKYGNDGRCFTRTTLYVASDLEPKQKIVIYDSGRARIAR